MRNKVEAMIVLFTFVSTPAAVPTAIVGGAVWTLTKSQEWAIVGMVGTYPVFLILMSMAAVAFAAFMFDRLGDDGQWVTVQSTGDDGTTHKKKRYIPPQVWVDGKRRHEIEQEMVHLNQ